MDESSNNSDSAGGRHGNRPSQSPINSAMRSPGVPSSSNNRMSPIASGGLSNSTTYGSNRLSPIVGSASNSMTHGVSRMSPIGGGSSNSMAHGGNRTPPITSGYPPGTRTSPLTGSSNVRKSPIAGSSSSNRMSPSMYGVSQPTSRQSPLPATRQSPIQPNRRSPVVSRGSPMDGMVKSPLTFVDSPTSRMNHVGTELSKHSSLSENNIMNAISQKTLDAARSLNSLGTLHTRPLLSERYETLSDDDS